MKLATRLRLLEMPKKLYPWNLKNMTAYTNPEKA